MNKLIELSKLILKIKRQKSGYSTSCHFMQQNTDEENRGDMVYKN